MFAQTGIHHVGGLIERNAADDYSFVALRTFALTVWDALTDVAYPFVIRRSFTASGGVGAS
jgi:sarcosine oxidase gamma subunit